MPTRIGASSRQSGAALTSGSARRTPAPRLQPPRRAPRGALRGAARARTRDPPRRRRRRARKPGSGSRRSRASRSGQLRHGSRIHASPRYASSPARPPSTRGGSAPRPTRTRAEARRRRGTAARVPSGATTMACAPSRPCTASGARRSSRRARSTISRPRLFARSSSTARAASLSARPGRHQRRAVPQRPAVVLRVRELEAARAELARERASARTLPRLCRWSTTFSVSGSPRARTGARERELLREDRRAGDRIGAGGRGVLHRELHAREARVARARRGLPRRSARPPSRDARGARSAARGAHDLGRSRRSVGSPPVSPTCTTPSSRASRNARAQPAASSPSACAARSSRVRAVRAPERAAVGELGDQVPGARRTHAPSSSDARPAASPRGTRSTRARARAVGMARAQRGRDPADAALAVGEREDRATALVQLHGALGEHDERPVDVVAQARARGEAEAPRAPLDAVEELPEDLALALERGDRALLVLGRRRRVEHVTEPFRGVARRLLGAAPEVAEPGGVHPRVVLLEARDPLGHEAAGGELGERRGHRLEEVVAGDEAHVRVARAAHAGQDVAQRRDLAAVEADGVGEAEPEVEAALAGAVAVVIADAADPAAAERRVLALREDDRRP